MCCRAQQRIDGELNVEFNFVGIAVAALCKWKKISH